jgi:hypothetical protein
LRAVGGERLLGLECGKAHTKQGQKPSIFVA